MLPNLKFYQFGIQISNAFNYAAFKFLRIRFFLALKLQTLYMKLKFESIRDLWKLLN